MAAQTLASILLEEAGKLAGVGDTTDAAALQKIAGDLGLKSGMPGTTTLAGGLVVPTGILGNGLGGAFGVPHLAKGGIVTKPTLALIGEAGREAIVPLDSHGIAGGGSVIDNHITVQLDGRVVWAGLKRHAVRDGRLNVKTGIK
jgi:hypothetical protein